jgi:hypothetical protein
MHDRSEIRPPHSSRRPCVQISAAVPCAPSLSRAAPTLTSRGSARWSSPIPLRPTRRRGRPMSRGRSFSHRVHRCCTSRRFRWPLRVVRSSLRCCGVQAADNANNAGVYRPPVEFHSDSPSLLHDHPRRNCKFRARTPQCRSGRGWSEFPIVTELCHGGPVGVHTGPA